MSEITYLKDHELSQWVINKLKELGHSRSRAWLLNKSEPIMGNDPYVMIQINNRLRQVVGELDVMGVRNTIMERAALVHDLPVDKWKELISQSVLPLIAKHQLPKD